MYQLAQVLRSLIELRTQWQQSAVNISVSCQQLSNGRKDFLATAQIWTSEKTTALLDQLRAKHDALLMEEMTFESHLQAARMVAGRLSRCEEDLIEQYTRLYCEDSLAVSADAPCITGNSSVSSTPEGHKEIPGLVDQYFDILADIKLLQERVWEEIPAEYEERSAEAERLCYQGSPQPHSVESWYHEQLRNANMQMHHLKTRADELMTACIDQGWSVDPDDYASPDDDSSQPAAEHRVERWLDALSMSEPPTFSRQEASWTEPIRSTFRDQVQGSTAQPDTSARRPEGSHLDIALANPAGNRTVWTAGRRNTDCDRSIASAPTPEALGAHEISIKPTDRSCLIRRDCIMHRCATKCRCSSRSHA